MDKNRVGSYAAECFEGELNCAESITIAISELFIKEENKDILNAAAFFGGGVGSTREEMCGAISGSILIIGHYIKKFYSNIDIEEFKPVIKSVLDEFNTNFATTKCGELIEGLDEDSKKNKCSKIVRFTAELIYDKLDQIKNRFPKL